MVNAVIAERSPEAVKAVADARARGAVAFLRDGRDPGAAVGGRRAPEHQALHGAARKGVGQARPGLAQPARHAQRAAPPRLLAEVGYRWYGDTFDDDLPYVQTFGERRIVAIPLSTDVNDMPSMKYGAPPRAMLDTFEEHLNDPAAGNADPSSSTSRRTRTSSAVRTARMYYEKIIEIASQIPRGVDRHAARDRRSHAASNRMRHRDSRSRLALTRTDQPGGDPLDIAAWASMKTIVAMAAFCRVLA